VGREFIWLIFTNEGEVENGHAHLKSVDIFWLWEFFGKLISF
jgi:hypothetical protein